MLHDRVIAPMRPCRAAVRIATVQWTNVAIRPTAIGTPEHGNEEALDHGTNRPSRHGNLEVAERRTDAVSGPRAAGVGCFGPCGDASVHRSLRPSTTADSALTAVIPTAPEIRDPLTRSLRSSFAARGIAHGPSCSLLSFPSLRIARLHADQT